MTVKLAVIVNDDIQVINIILADSKEFFLQGYDLICIDGVYCESGMFYNKKDGLFYYDRGFSLTKNPITDPSQIALDGLVEWVG